MESESVLNLREPPLGWLVLNRPEVRNALNLDTYRRIIDGIGAMENDPDIRIVILRGSDPSAFISGADISEFKTLRSDAEKAKSYRVIPRQAIESLMYCKKPLLAMISGLCLGGGVHVALCCDIRIAATGTRFGIPAARLGLAYPTDGVKALIDTVGGPNTLEILMSARTFDAQEALSKGLVHHVVKSEELEDYVRKYASQMAANAPLTMAAAKFAVKDLLKDPSRRDQAAVDALVARCFDSEDYQEGLRAFAQKRQPKFSGR